MTCLNVGDVSLNVEIRGEGPALFTLHGFTGSSATWSPFLPDWRDRRTVVSIDLLGHGDSDAPADPARYQVDRCVADLFAVADQLGQARFDLLGYSLGGRVALHLAATAPQRIRALILESASPGILDPDECQARRDSDEGLAKLLETDGIQAFVDRWEQVPLFASQRELPTEVRARLRAQRLRSNPLGLANSLRGIGAGVMPPVHDRFGRVEAPTLLIVGARDLKYVGIGRELAMQLPRARLEIVPGAGHAVHLERSAAFSEAIVGFLERAGATG